LILLEARQGDAQLFGEVLPGFLNGVFHEFASAFLQGGGFFFFALGNLIHLVLIAALILVIAPFVTARRSEA
jgi:hypothetical protein